MGAILGTLAPLELAPGRVAAIFGDPRQRVREARTGERAAWALADEARSLGMCAFLEESEEAILVGYGDPLGGAEARLPASSLEAALVTAQRSFSRFAFARCEAGRVTLCTDWGGGCPLFYGFHPSGPPVFASEAKALLALLPASRRLRDLGEGRQAPPPGETIFPGIHVAPPGSVLEITREGRAWRIARRSRYFRPPERPRITDLDEAAAALAEALERAVARDAAGVGEVGVMLSGGVDSTSVAALARAHADRVIAFTAGTPFGDEFDAARRAAEALDIEHHALRFDAADLARALPDLIWGMECVDELTLERAAPAAHVYRAASPRPQVFLSGYGADLIFAGTLDPLAPPETLERQIREGVAAVGAMNELSPATASRVGIAVRYPFWSPEVLSVGLDIAAPLKVRDGIEKHVLRCAVAPRVPRESAWRRKLGIHEGSAMDRVFGEALEAATPAERRERIRRIAEDVFFGSRSRLTI